MHEPPYVPNLAPEGPGKGMALDVGIVLAIEPMATLGQPATRTLDDDWTVVTARRPPGGPLGAHGGGHAGRPVGAHRATTGASLTWPSWRGGVVPGHSA